MAPSSSSSLPTTSVQVALRIRPPTSQDSHSIPARFQRSVIQATSSTSVTIESPSNAIAGAGASAPAASLGSAAKKQLFSFDQVHSPPTTQYELFTSTAQPLLSRFIEGFNCTILAYGQTSSGKTFTMTGVDLDADPSDPHNGMGIIPRAVSTIFSRAKQLKEERGGTWSFGVKASFIEIYNEDLIDLLSFDDSTGGRREVQIREDKEGHIIWGGLREVSVKNSSEVMSLLRKGTSIRRTNETDMNAQSSRSHAIFSLTLTQKKYTGSGVPPRSPSPLPPGGRSPSRLARPGSMYAGPSGTRVASPTFGRPATPSFAAAMGRGGGLRPASALGHAGERSLGTSNDDEVAEWVTITSKFHFVDLAGSERLKRTAAAGERIKEGISINSGLLALGNVISALGDPSRAKSNTATHIPYRDSKLTRLLQDSLGGNAHTLMIACVSPAEWNAGETINTLKYANRARNIKNRAVVNEKEDGWDDVEWLQGTVARLRKELKVIKEGGLVVSSDREPEVLEGAGKKVLAQITELQNNYEDLREKFVERTEELTRLRRELGERHRTSSTGAVGGTAKYEEIVGPVIEEYEKTISAMEAELSLNRAALRHTNEMVEEKEDELAVLTERHSATELYVEELRARVAKLSEREASTEAYVRDLEEKLKLYDETSITSSESMTDLKREIAHFKDSEGHSNKYIADLEARLSRSDESILQLQQTVEKLEREAERRLDEISTLQSRLETLRRDGESWRTDLEERERKVKDLEEKMVEWEMKKKEAGETRARLGNVVEEVELARRGLQNDFNAISTGIPSASPEESPRNPGSPASAIPSELDQGLQSQLLSLQETHTATLADLSSITAKYRDALKEISDLVAQIEELKINPSIAEATVIESPIQLRSVESSLFRKRATGGRIRESGESHVNSAGRRLFFRQAASAESLHSRSLSQSLSLSQELSSVHSRKTSFSSHGTSSSHSPSNSHSQSLSTLYSSGSRPNLSITLPTAISPAASQSERSVSSLEKEIMRLQEVLKERESEISLLEESLKASQIESRTTTPSTGDNATSTADGVAVLDLDLSPKTLNRFDHIRKTMENGNGSGQHSISSETESIVHSEPDDSLERLNELMLSMAQKESYHREVVDELNSQLSQTKRQLDDLTTLSRDQASNMSMELEALRSKHIDDLTLLEEVRAREKRLVQDISDAEDVYKREVDQLRIDHAKAMEEKGIEVDELIGRMNSNQDSPLAILRTELEAASLSLEKARQDHEDAFGKLKSEHEAELQRQIREANGILSRTKQEHEEFVFKIRNDHEATIKQKEEEVQIALQNTEEEYYNALTKLRGDHARAIETLATENDATIERLKEEHAGQLRIAEIAREGSISESESSRSLALKGLQDEHLAAIARKDASHMEEIENLKSAQARAIKAKEDDHTLQLDRLRLEYESSLAKVKAEWRAETDRLNDALAAEKKEACAISLRAQNDFDAALQVVKEQQAAVLQQLESSHEEMAKKLKSDHHASLQKASEDGATQKSALTASHKVALVQLKDEHQKVVSKLNAAVEADRELHRKEVDELRAEHQKLLKGEKQSFSISIDKLRQQHAQELKTTREDHDLLVQELEAHKVAADEFTLLREETRQNHEYQLQDKADAIEELGKQISSIRNDRDALHAEVKKLRAELETTHQKQSKLIQEASEHESLVVELEHHRSVLAEVQENLQKVSDEKDILQSEKNRSDSVVRDLQAQLARSASPPNARSPDRSIGYNRSTALPAIKLPPPTPPPSVPPPPAPRSANLYLNGDSIMSTSSQASSVFNSSASSRESQPESPSTSVGHTTLNGVSSSDKVAIKFEQQAKQIEEQEVIIKTLNKQLTHCESDLQTHMDLVNTLETSLGDSEKNLRKARMQATELARERDTLNHKLETLRSELTEAQREVVSVRRSVVEEKQSLEQRLDEERKAKERVRQQLDSRMEELQRRKSKFACL